MRAITILLIGGLFALAQSAGESGKKLPVPDQAAQAKSLALVLDIFGEDIKAAQEPQAKAKLAINLLQQGKESRDDAANRYVLFREARDLAAKAGDANLTLLAVEEMARDFDVSALDLKAAALAVAADNVPSKEASKTV